MNIKYYIIILILFRPRLKITLHRRHIAEAEDHRSAVNSCYKCAMKRVKHNTNLRYWKISRCYYPEVESFIDTFY